MFDFLVDVVFQAIGEGILYFLPISERSKEKVRLYGGLGFIVIVGVVLLILIYIY